MNMTINDVPLSDYGATLLSADYGCARVTNYNNWLRGAKKPLEFGQDITYTEATYTILVEGSSLHEVDKNCSDIYSAMAKAIVKVDDANWSVDGHLTSIDKRDKISPLAREIDINFEGIKVADRETLNHVILYGSPWKFKAKGNQEVPCRIEIHLDRAYTQLQLTVNGKLFKVNNTGSGATWLVIDSEKGVVALDGANKMEDYVSWEMPTIKGGMNSLSINGAPELNIVYNGRWM